MLLEGGPSGATAAEDLVRSGHSVALLDREGRIKPCGGAIPPRLMEDFHIKDEQLVAKVNTARMIAPSGRHVDIPIENGFVGMVDRKDFDPFLRARAVEAGAEYYTGTFVRIARPNGTPCRDLPATRRPKKNVNLPCKLVIGADGAKVPRGPGRGQKTPTRSRWSLPTTRSSKAPPKTDIYDPARCDVIYDGAISPDFYGWVFPHGDSASVGMGSELSSVNLKAATAALRVASGLEHCETLRKEGAPIPLKPLDCWDNGKDVVLAGDAAGVVAPSSGEGIYYAMVGGRVAATACAATLASGRVKDLRLARKLFMREHKTVFRVLASMQNAYYRSDDRRERFVSLCHDIDVQRLTFEAYMNKTFGQSAPLGSSENRD